MIMVILIYYNVKFAKIRIISFVFAAYSRFTEIFNECCLVEENKIL